VSNPAVMERVTTWLDITEAARRLGVHRRTVMRWCEAGKLGADAKKTPGGHWRVREEWVREQGRLR
jgi:excisionase family DNA binding protein